MEPSSPGALLRIMTCGGDGSKGLEDSRFRAAAAVSVAEVDDERRTEDVCAVLH